jgi:outer membrane protein OmpA-like peptidoglycan-associated protein
VATLQFGRGSAALAREEYVILRAVAALRAGNGGSIEIIGHADRGGARGSATGEHINQLVSERRAAAVADALVTLGLPRRAIAAEGRGDREPRFAESNAAGAAGNRRAEIYLDSSEPPPATAEQRSSEDESSPVARGAGAIGAEVLERQAGEPAVPDAEKSGFTDGTGAVNSPTAAETAAADRPTRRIRVATLYFGHASSRLGERERAIIEAAAAFQRQSQGALVIVGHASAAGAPQQDTERLDRANQVLSLARADAVAKRLAASGVSGENLSVLGKGSDEPAFAEKDAAAEAGNRRVEIYVDVPADVRLADRGDGLSR